MCIGKCTKLPNEVYRQYLDLLLKEIAIIRPKKIITFGNQVSSIILNEKIAVSQCRKKSFTLNVDNQEYPVYPVYYPVGNGSFNIDKALEDLKWIINQMEAK